MAPTLFQTLKSIWQETRLPFYLIAGATVILIIFTFTRTRLTTNPRSRIITVQRVLDKGTFAHKTPTDSAAYPLSKDMVKLGDNYYSSKPPIYPLIMIAEMWVPVKLSGDEFKAHDRTWIRILTLINQVFPFGLMLIVALAWLGQQVRDRWTLSFMMIALSFGSLVFAYAVTLNNHTPAAICYVLAFWWVWRIREGGDLRWKTFIALGLACGIGAMLDLTAAFVGLVLMGAALLKDPKRTTLAGLAAFIPVLITMICFFNLSGSVLPFYLQPETYHFDGSWWDQKTGIDALQEPKWQYLFNVLFTHHGLFSLSPLLLTGAATIIIPRFRRKLSDQKLVWALLGGMAIVIGVIVYKTGNYGGYCVGMRWFIAFMPLLMLMGWPLVSELGSKPWGRIVLLILLIWSVAIIWEPIYYEAFIQSWFEKLWYSWFGVPWEN